jgi:rod shape-determining protein MreC
LAWAVIVFAVFLITLTAIRLSGAGSSFANPVGSALRALLAPAEQFIWDTGNAVKNNAQAIFQFSRIKAENEQLRAQVAQLTSDNLELKENILAGLRYNELEENVFENPLLEAYDKIGAKIIRRDPATWYRMLTLNKGSQNGVAVNDAVVGNLGLVGKVVTVTWTTCDVLLLTDGEGQVAALTRDSVGGALFGVVKGNYRQGSRLDLENSLEMEFRQEDEINAGEVVYTSGLGGIYPKGLPVGVVTEVKMSGSGMLKLAYIEPLAEFDALEEVYIVKMAVAE